MDFRFFDYGQDAKAKTLEFPSRKKDKEPVSAKVVAFTNRSIESTSSPFYRVVFLKLQLAKEYQQKGRS